MRVEELEAQLELYQARAWHRHWLHDCCTGGGGLLSALPAMGIEGPENWGSGSCSLSSAVS